MPFESRAQLRAAFGGHLGPEMKKKAKVWAEETPDIKALPQHKGGDTARARAAKRGHAKFKKYHDLMSKGAGE